MRLPYNSKTQTSSISQQGVVNMVKPALLLGLSASVVYALQ